MSARDLADTIGSVSDAVALADELQYEIHTFGDADAAKELARDILDDLQCAETVESLADFDANVAEARAKLAKLRAIVDDEWPVAYVAEVRATMRQLDRELAEVTPRGRSPRST